MKKIISIIVLIVVLLGVAYFFYRKETITPVVIPPVKIDTSVAERINVDNYLRANISRLSPILPVLGGNWYVVSNTVDLIKNSGTVVYEDGHIQETKSFSYSANERGEVVSLTITNDIIPVEPVNPVACTMEAKQCPDGSYVGRSGPKCEFSKCPDVITVKSGITGEVRLSPVCPVENAIPDPACAPRFYSTSINIVKDGSTKIIQTIQSNTNGQFSVDLTPGTYTLQAKGGSVYPRCAPISVEVKSGQYTMAQISCDTGIR